jgi:hemerythrin-like domain-containing protein
VDAETSSDRPLIQQMVVIHRVFRREFGLLPGLIRRVTPGDVARASVVADHAANLLEFVHVHHSGEDEFLWPVLLERVEVKADLIYRMEAQHEYVARLVDRARLLLPAWANEPTLDGTAVLAATFDDMAGALGEHLGDEEVEILPLAEIHLSVAEWNRLGEHARAGLSPPVAMASLAAILEEADDDERAMFTKDLPPPVLTMFVTQAEPAYREQMRRIRADA